MDIINGKAIFTTKSDVIEWGVPRDRAGKLEHIQPGSNFEAEILETHTLKDDTGRLIWVDLESDINSGHSVCCGCGKDMPDCWDVVCSVCGSTLCYDCAYEKDGKWICI